MSLKFQHFFETPPEKPILHFIDAYVVGDSAVVADGPVRGDVIVTSEVRNHPPSEFSIMDKSNTTWTYYRVERVSKPNGVCHGHSLLTLKELG